MQIHLPTRVYLFLLANCVLRTPETRLIIQALHRLRGEVARLAFAKLCLLRRQVEASYLFSNATKKKESLDFVIISNMDIQ